MIRPLGPGDTAEALRLLGARPLHNVFLEHLVRVGALGTLPRFFGFFVRQRLEGILLVSLGGATALDVRNPAAHEPFARAAANEPTPARHIVGSEDVTMPFFEAYRPRAAPEIWERREPVYVVTPRDRAPDLDAALEPAQLGDLAAIADNSACQHVEDLKEDRSAQDPAGFRERHRREVQDGRWWILRERGRIAFQVHVGAENTSAVQIGGVYVPPDLRGHGYALRGVAGISRRLLEARPAVTLYCDEANAVARHVYERVGFRNAFWQRSWLLETRVRAKYA